MNALRLKRTRGALAIFDAGREASLMRMMTATTDAEVWAAYNADTAAEDLVREAFAQDDQRPRASTPRMHSTAHHAGDDRQDHVHATRARHVRTRPTPAFERCAQHVMEYGERYGTNDHVHACCLPFLWSELYLCQTISGADVHSVMLVGVHNHGPFNGSQFTVSDIAGKKPTLASAYHMALALLWIRGHPILVREHTYR